MGMIELTGVTRVYRSGAVAVEALRGIDLTVEKGEFAAVMGPSGSGKSTLMNIIGCLDQATDGRYTLAGEDVSKLSRDRLAGIRNRTIGFVFQQFNLLPRTTALENVELPLLYTAEPLSWKEMHDRATQALERVGLGDRLDHTPAQLSGGQQQRVAIARALVTRPELLLADEPTGNLDTRTSVEIIQMLQELNDAGLTILMVTHEPEVARAASRTIMIRDGLIQRDDRTQRTPASELLAQWVEDDWTDRGAEPTAEQGVLT
jgi:putative ABC transport system ATP-binding protein